MDHAFGMGAIEGTADLLHHADSFLGRELSRAAQERAQVLAVDVFHTDEADAIGLAQVVDADHVLVRNVARENQLLLEALQNRGIGRQFGTDHLKRDQAVEFAVARLVDRAHAALPQHTQNLVTSTEKHARLQTQKGGDAAGRGCRGHRRRCLASVRHGWRLARNRGSMRQSGSVGERCVGKRQRRQGRGANRIFGQANTRHRWAVGIVTPVVALIHGIALGIAPIRRASQGADSFPRQRQRSPQVAEGKSRTRHSDMHSSIPPECFFGECGRNPPKT